MGSFSLWHWLVVLVIILIFFGAGKLPRVMGDFAKGIKAFRAGMKDEAENKVEDQSRTIDQAPGTAHAKPGPAEADKKVETVQRL